jgi:glycosyltransferase involved in cell wall biosynthesis
LRVLHLLKTSVGATWALRQMRELVKLGVEVHVAMPDGQLVDAYHEAGINVHLAQFDFPLKTPWHFPQMATQFRTFVEHIKPDIIHSHFVGTTLVMRLALGKTHPIPRIFQVPGPLHLENRFFRQAEIQTAGLRDYWVGSCQWTYHCYQRMGISPERVFLSYYGTDLDRLDIQQKGKLRRELGLEDTVPLVGMVAFMYPPKFYLGQTRGLKGHEDLIEAIKICQAHLPTLRGVFIGGAWNNITYYEKRVIDHAKRYCGDSIIFLGNRSDVPDLYPDIDVAVHPSHSENVGGAVESLLMGIPTIATQVGGFPDVVIDGETGWLVPPKKPEQLAETILKALANPQQAHDMAHRGQELVRSMFDVQQTSAQVLDIYQTVSERCVSGIP